MSAAVRAMLAAAANTVDGVDLSPRLRQANMRPGLGGIRLDGVEYENRLVGGFCTWQVVICLPTTTEHAEDWVDEHVTPLYDALSPHLDVQHARSVQLVLPEVGAVPALVITGTREQEK